MPLTLQQKQEMLRSKGYDPSRYFFEEDTGDIYEGQDPSVGLQPSENIITPRVDNSPKTSATKVFAKSFITNLAPTAGAFGAGTLGFKIPGPLPLKIVAGLGTALAGGAAVSKLQEQIIPPALYPTPEEQQQHTYAALAGQLAPSLAALDPIESIKSLGRAGSTIGKRLLYGYSAPMKAEMAALRNFGLNTGVNVGTQAGLNIVNQLRSEEPFNYSTLARDAALGLLLNEPTKLGTKLFGFHPSYKEVKTEAQILAERQGLNDQLRAQELAQQQAQESVISPSVLEHGYGVPYTPDLLAAQGRLPTNKPGQFSPYPIIRGLKGVEARLAKLPPTSPFHQAEPRLQEEALGRLEGEGGIVIEPPYVEPEIPVTQVIGQEPSFYSKPPVKGKGVEIQQRSDTGAPYKYAQGVEPLTVTEQAAEKLLDKILRRRGLKLGQYGKGQILDTKGNVILGSKNKPIAGRALPASRTIDIASKTAPDIAHHEAFHIQLSDLANSLDARDRELVSKVFKEAGRPDLTAEEFARLNTEEAKAKAEGRIEDANRIREQYIGVEEDLASFMGMEGAKRELQGGVKQWLKDFGSRFNIGERPARQQLSARQKYEAPYGTREVEGIAQGEAKMAQGRRPYGFWISPDGNMTEVPMTHGHNKGAEEILAKMGINMPKRHDAAFELLSSQSYVRGVFAPRSNTLMVESVRPLSYKARQALRDYGIENNVNVEYHPFDPSNYMGGRPVDIYRVGEGEKFSEQESQYTPEVARENKTGSIKNKLGHYLGTSYHGTPEDYARYNEIQKEFGALKSKGLSLASPEGQALYKENETLKNKYGGMPPYPPKEHQNATSKISNEESFQREREKGNARGQTAETSSSNSIRNETQSTERKINYDETTRQSNIEPTGIKTPSPEEGNKSGEKRVRKEGEGFKGEEKLSEEESKYSKANKKILEEQHNKYYRLQKNYHNELFAELNKTNEGQYLEKIKNSILLITKEEPFSWDIPTLIENNVPRELAERYIFAKEVYDAKKNEINKNKLYPKYKNIQEQQGLTEFNTPWRPRDFFAEDNISKNSEEESAYKRGKEMQEHYGEASFKAAREAEKEQKHVRESIRAGLNPEGRDLEEAFNKANFKANEAEAFERPDVERHAEEESVYTKDPNLLPKKPIFSLTTSVTDKIAEGKRGSYIHEKASSKLRNYFNSANQRTGAYGQNIVKEFENYTPEEVNNVQRYRWEKDNNEPTSRSLTPKEEELNRAYQTNIQRPKEDAAELGLKVKRGETYTIGGVKPEGYLPNVIDPDKLWLINERPNSVEAKSYKRQWKEWIVKKGGSAKDADTLVENYFRAQRQYGDTGGPEFNALRKAEGYGLPWELMDKNFARATMRYARRAANDISFFEHIQSDPEMQKALGVKDQYGNNPEGMEKIDYIGSEKNVQDAMSFIWGKQEVANPRFSALMRFAGNLVMGHGTAIRNLAALSTQVAPYGVRFRDIVKGLANLSESRRRAYESGAARINTAEFEYLGEMGNPDPVVRTLDKMSNWLRKLQGRNLSDKMEGEILYGIGEEWAKNQIAEDNLDILKRASGKADYKIPERPTTKDIQELAAGFVRLTRGDYGPTGLPVWALKGNIAPFVALNRFGIEKWNNVVKDVIQPMKQGNLMPFLKYTLSGVLTGAMIEQMNEMLSGKKGSDLNVNETLAAYAETQDPELFAHKIIGLMQLSSYGGLMGDMAKIASRASQGKEISYSNPIGMPLYTLVTETFGENLSAAIGALRSGEDPINVFAEFAKTVPLQTIQATRYAKSRLDEDAGRKEAYRDIRLYKEATGKASREELKASKGNPYQDIEAKKFKKTEDINEAARMLPTLLQAAIKRAGNDPYKLKAEFQKLKANNFQVMPSIETQPFEFYKYVTYLRKSQGEEKAGERVAKFFLQREVNKVKSSLVP